MTIKSASQKRMQRRTNNESTDGTDFPGSIGQHGSQDRLLAGGIRGALLCVPRCWRGCGTSLAKRRATTNRSEERFAGESDSPDGAVQAGREGAKGIVPDTQAFRYEFGGLR